MSTIPPSTTKSTTISSWTSTAGTHSSLDILILLQIPSSMTCTSPALPPSLPTFRAATSSALNKTSSRRRCRSYVKGWMSFRRLGSRCRLASLIELSRRTSSRSIPWPLRSAFSTSRISTRLGSRNSSKMSAWYTSSPISHGI